jgi:hypothetical protein
MIDKHILVMTTVHPARQEFLYVYTFYLFLTILGRLNFDSIFKSHGGKELFLFVGVKK